MSITTDEVRAVGRRLQADGFDYSAGIVLHAAERMEAMEALIIELRDTVEDLDA